MATLLDFSVPKQDWLMEAGKRNGILYACTVTLQRRPKDARRDAGPWKAAF